MTAEPRLADVITATDRDAFWAGIGVEPVVRRASFFDGSPVWLVTGYDEAVAVIKDPARFSNDINMRKDALDVLAAAGPEGIIVALAEQLG